MIAAKATPAPRSCQASAAMPTPITGTASAVYATTK